VHQHHPARVELRAATGAVGRVLYPVFRRAGSHGATDFSAVFHLIEQAQKRVPGCCGELSIALVIVDRPLPPWCWRCLVL